MPDEYISREEAIEEIDKWLDTVGTALVGKGLSYYGELIGCIEDAPAADVAEVVHCKDCKYSTLPSELTQRYGKPGTLTCHNKYSPCNRRNVSENDFCNYGEAE